MLELILGKDWIKNSDTIMDMIAADVHGEKGGRILIVPELISHDTERRLCEAGGDTVSRFATVTGFSRLPGLIGRYCKEAVPDCLDQAGCVAAMASAARQLHGSLKAYAAVESRPEFLTQMVDAVDEFKRCCITPEDLEKAAGACSGEFAQKIGELALLLKTYDAVCAQGKRDPRDLLNWALETLEDTDFAENHVFYIDGFPDFTHQHMAILKHFIVHSPRVVISMNCDRLNSSKFAFEKAGSTAKQLADFAQQYGVECRVVDGRDDQLSVVREKLFQGEIEKQEEMASCLGVYALDSAHRECQAAAEDILGLIDRGARFRDIAVVCTDVAKYRPILGMALRNMGIPFYLSGTEVVSDSFVMNTVFSAIEATQSSFEKSAMRRYLRSVLSPVDAETCDLMENYVFTWYIQGKDWKYPWTKHPRGLENDWNPADHDLLNRLEKARKTVMGPLLTMQSGLASATNIHQQIQVLYQFFENIHLSKGMQQLAQQLDEQMDYRNAQMVNQLWDILLTALEQLDDILGATAWDSETFSRLLKLILGQYDVGTIPAVLDAVTVGPVSAMRCQRAKHLLILGCDEGKFPGYSGGSSVLTDADRDTLRRLQVHLTGGSLEGIQVEFASVYGVFCGATDSVHLYCSHSQPSFVFRRMMKLLGMESAIRTQEDMIANRYDAAAYLARFHAEEAAKDNALQEEYLQMKNGKDYQLGQITRDNVDKLYGQTIHLSASKVDSFAQCRLAYFLNYGLKLQERKEATIDSMQYGTYIHDVLENTVKDVMNSGGFERISQEKVQDIAKMYSDAYIRDNFSQIDSNRLKFLQNRNYHELKWIVKELWEELRVCGYRPAFEELAFQDEKAEKTEEKHTVLPSIPIPSTSVNAVLEGKIDRLDIFDPEDSDEKFIRVVDYKTGKKTIEYVDLINGIGLQMLLYLFAVQDRAAHLKDGDDALFDSEPIPGGVEYFPARAPYVKLDGFDANEQKARDEAWQRSGMILSDEISMDAMDPTEDKNRLPVKRDKKGNITENVATRGQMKQLKKYVFKLLTDMVDEIGHGVVTPNPYKYGSKFSSCQYCPFGDICQKENEPGMRSGEKVNDAKFWEIIAEECENDGR